MGHFNLTSWHHRMAFLQGRGEVSITKPAPNWKWIGWAWLPLGFLGTSPLFLNRYVGATIVPWTLSYLQELIQMASYSLQTRVSCPPVVQLFSFCTIDRWSCYSIQHCCEKNVPTGVIFDQIFKFKTLLEASSVVGYFSLEYQTWNEGLQDVHPPPTLTLRSRTVAAKPTHWPTLNPCHFTVPCFIFKTKTFSFSLKQALSNNVFGVKIGRTTTLRRLFEVINFRRSKFVCTLSPCPVFGLATHLTTPVCPVARTQTINLQVVYSMVGVQGRPRQWKRSIRKTDFKFGLTRRLHELSEEFQEIRTSNRAGVAAWEFAA